MRSCGAGEYSSPAYGGRDPGQEDDAQNPESFQSGTLRVLTAKRVLDEGVNVPEITTAYILASTTVERQWVQRRGRILRKCAALEKPYATLHDFLVLPPTLGDAEDRDARTMVKQEALRVM